MSVNKKRNRFFILKIILLTLALIGCFTIAFISILFLIIDGFKVILLLGTFGGVLLGIVFVKAMIKLNKSWMTQMIAEIKNGTIKSTLTWNFDQEEWSRFITWRKSNDKSDLKGTIILNSIIASIVFFAIAYTSFTLPTLVGISLGGGIVFGTLISFLMYMGMVVQTKKMASGSSGRITFTENSILVNDLLIYFNQIGTSLKKMSIVQQDGWLLLYVTILMQAGTRKNEKEYTFPIPNDKVSEAEKLVELYGFSSEHKTEGESVEKNE